jgi:hypothetical protein
VYQFNLDIVYLECGEETNAADLVQLL